MAFRNTPRYTVQQVLEILQNVREGESEGEGEFDSDWSLDGSAGSDSDTEEEQPPPAKRSRVVHPSGSGDTFQGIEI